MFVALTVTLNLIALIVLYFNMWGAYKREQAATDRLAGGDKRVGRHRATNRPTMTWRL